MLDLLEHGTLPSMRPWELIDEEAVPEDDGIIYLFARGPEFTIVVDDRELMASKMHGSEDALADFACDRLNSLEDARVLVGGLGMGFTLAAVLRRLGERGHATVAELIPAVVRWNRDHVGHVARHPLRDPRVAVHAGDICDLVDDPTASWSAILLDIDNGPMSLTRLTNGWLYTRQGLRKAYAALIPGGVLGVWSAQPDPSFTRRLRRAGFEVEALRHTEEGRPSPDGRGTHFLWMARRD